MHTMPKVYDYKDLVMAYIDAHRRGYLHEDFKTYFQSRLPKLEEAFDIYFKNGDKALMMYFRAAAETYYSIHHPANGFLEFGLIDYRLKSAEEIGSPVRKLHFELMDKVKDTRETLLEMMYQLFILMHGETDKTVTSEDLLRLGFDEATEPKERDYWD